MTVFFITGQNYSCFVFSLRSGVVAAGTKLIKETEPLGKYAGFS
jgi:hypothetical protein